MYPTDNDTNVTDNSLLKKDPNVNAGRVDPAMAQKYQQQNQKLLKVCKFFLTPFPMVTLLIVMTMCQLPFLILAFVEVMNDSTVQSYDLAQQGMDLFTKEYAALSYIVYGVIGLLIFGLWYGLAYVKKEPRKINPLESVSPSAVFLSVGAAIGSFGIVELFMTLLSLLAPSVIESYAERIENSGIIGFDGIFSILSMYLVAPIIEELAIRGLSMKLLKWTGFGAAGILIWQAVFFGIMHLDPVQSSYTFLIGLVLGYMAYRYKSIYVSILTHVFFNIFGTVIPTLLSKLTDVSDADNSTLHLIVYISALLIGVIFVILDHFLKKYIPFWKETAMEILKKITEYLRSSKTESES